jgi:hypothetical protein
MATIGSQSVLAQHGRDGWSIGAHRRDYQNARLELVIGHVSTSANGAFVAGRRPVSIS